MREAVSIDSPLKSFPDPLLRRDPAEGEKKTDHILIINFMACRS